MGHQMGHRLASLAPWLAFGGLVALLIGLDGDFVLHRLDPELAAREGGFGVANPAHALVAMGLGLVVLGTVSLLLASAPRSESAARRALHAAPAAGLVALAALTAVVLAASGSGPFAEAAHADDGAAARGHRALGDSQDVAALQAELDAKVAAGAMSPGQADFILRQVRATVHDHGEGVPVTRAELVAAAQLVADVERGTARFADYGVAQAEGYVPLPFGRDGLVHVHNWRAAAEGRSLDAERPQQLIYLRRPDGAMQLVGAMFLAPRGGPGPRVGGPLTAWHAHDNVCYGPDGRIPVGVTDAAGACAPGATQGKSEEMLHVWLWDNPRGVFDSWMEPAVLLRQIESSP